MSCGESLLWLGIAIVLGVKPAGMARCLVGTKGWGLGEFSHLLVIVGEQQSKTAQWVKFWNFSHLNKTAFHQESAIYFPKCKSSEICTLKRDPLHVDVKTDLWNPFLVFNKSPKSNIDQTPAVWCGCYRTAVTSVSAGGKLTSQTSLIADRCDVLQPSCCSRCPCLVPVAPVVQYVLWFWKMNFFHRHISERRWDAVFSCFRCDGRRSCVSSHIWTFPRGLNVSLHLPTSDLTQVSAHQQYLDKVAWKPVGDWSKSS